MELLLETHFPGSTIQRVSEGECKNCNGQANVTSRAISLSNKIFISSRVKWATLSFKLYKAPGSDGIFLQKNIEDIISVLCSLYKASFRLGYISKLWREATVVFIPKRRGRNGAPSRRPIYLTSFMLKGMEKVIDQFIRNEVLITSFLHMDFVLHRLVSKIKSIISAKETLLCAFIDIEGAFDNTSIESITTATERKGLDLSITTWIKAMLQSRKVKATLAGTTLIIGTTKDCPQGEVLLPSYGLWSSMTYSLSLRTKDTMFKAMPMT